MFPLAYSTITQHCVGWGNGLERSRWRASIWAKGGLLSDAWICPLVSTSLIYCGLVTLYGDIDYVTIDSGNGLFPDGNTWTDVDFSSVGFYGIHLKAIPFRVFLLLRIMNFEIIQRTQGEHPRISALGRNIFLTMKHRKCRKHILNPFVKTGWIPCFTKDAIDTNAHASSMNKAGAKLHYHCIILSSFTHKWAKKEHAYCAFITPTLD